MKKFDIKADGLPGVVTKDTMVSLLLAKHMHDARDKETAKATAWNVKLGQATTLAAL